MKNLVLIGLSGCGKSTFGKKLSRRLRMPLLDTDAMIVEAEGRAISDIFAERGEAFFRDMESAACQVVAEQEGIIISTGGGTCLRPEHRELMKNKGLYYELFTTQAKRYLTTIDGESAEQFMAESGVLPPHSQNPGEHPHGEHHGHHHHGHPHHEGGPGRPPLGEGRPPEPPKN